MSECLTTSGQPTHGPADPFACDARLARYERDNGILHTIYVICAECDGKYGPLMQGEWHFKNGVVYCPACYNAEAPL